MDCCQQLGQMLEMLEMHRKYHHSVIFLNLHLPDFGWFPVDDMSMGDDIVELNQMINLRNQKMICTR